MRDFQEITYQSDDGLTLYARDYGGEDKPVVLCMHGLSRNSADFQGLAQILQPRYRVISADQRGRGKSAWDPNPANYQLPRYCQDMRTLLDHLGLEHVALMGTSMGGLMSIIMMAQQSQGGCSRITGVIINDIGPVIDQAGLTRIKSYVGKTPPIKNWDEAVAVIKAQNGTMFPDLTDQDWRAFAGNILVEGTDGTLTPAYDPAISQNFDADDADAAPTDLWDVYAATTGTPQLVLRGEYSDILSADTAVEMTKRHPNCTLVTVPRVGHAPLLTEPVSVQAITRFLKQLS